MKNVYMMQLSPNYQFGNNDENSYFLPYSIALLQSYSQSIPDIYENYDFKELFFRVNGDEYDFSSTLKNPDVFAISNYVWNSNKHLRIAKIVKKLNPNCLIVIGGPHFPNNNIDFFKKYPFIDVGVNAEGEVGFSKILLNRLYNKNFSDINGIIYRDQKDIKKTIPAKRLTDINDIPSPYLNGILDDIVYNNPDVNFQTVLETDRGCPFKCAYCDWGVTNGKMKKFSEKRIHDEVVWMSEKKISWLWFTASNVGIFKDRDYAIIDDICSIKEKTGYPLTLANPSFAKTSFEKNSVIPIIKRLREVQNKNNSTVRIAIQSLNDNILNNIKRRNMDYDKLDNSYFSGGKRDMELIYPLPGDTYDDFVGNLTKIVRNKKIMFCVYPCAVLPNAPLSTPEYVEKYGIEVVSVSFDESGETIDFIKSLNTLSENECKMGWMAVWMLQCFWRFPFLRHIIDELEYKFGIDIKEFIIEFQSFLENVSSELSKLYHSIKEKLYTNAWIFDEIVFDNSKIIQILKNNKDQYYHEVGKFLNEFVGSNFDTLLLQQKETSLLIENV